MTAVDLTLHRDAETERVVGWRREELERAGYDVAAAARIAERTDVDLHLAVDLVRQGCSHEIALRILL